MLVWAMGYGRVSLWYKEQTSRGKVLLLVGSGIRSITIAENWPFGPCLDRVYFLIYFVKLV